MNRACWSLLGLVVAAACTERPTSVQTAAGTPGLAAAPAGDYVATPNGWYHRSCVHEIPNGARVSASGLVTRQDGSTYQIPKCGYAPYRATSHRPLAATLGNPLGGVEFAAAFLDTSDAYRKLTAHWKVPVAPVGSYPGGTVRAYYAYPALGTLYDNYLEPTLQYGFNGKTGGSYWTMASWYFYDSSNVYNAVHSTPISTTAGHELYGSVVASNCSNRRCTWTVLSKDLNTDSSTTLTVQSDSDAYGGVFGGAVEVLNFTSCDQFPSPGVFFTKDSVNDRTGTVSPDWQNYLVSNPLPCYFNVTSWNSITGGVVNLFHARSHLINAARG